MLSTYNIGLICKAEYSIVDEIINVDICEKLTYRM